MFGRGRTTGTGGEVEKRFRAGVDLGGTKIEAIVLDPEGVERFRERVATPRDYEGTLGAIASLIAAADAAVGARCSVGVGMPGVVSPTTGLVKNANSTWLIGRALDADLATRLGRPVRLMNDANCFALSEAADGAAAGARSVFGVILGTGVGGGIVIGGRIHDGAQLIAGEWGHNPLPWPGDDERPGPDCYCGRRGCIETFLSGPGLAADHERVAGVTATPEAIAAAADAGDAIAASTLARYVDRLGRGLATVVNLLDPEVIVLGGGLSHLPRLARRAEAALAGHVFSDTVSTRVVKNRHGAASGVRGAAWLWPTDR
jgi:fructokinase